MSIGLLPPRSAFSGSSDGTWSNRICSRSRDRHYVLFEAIFGRTPGKLITGTRTRVVTAKPGFGQIIGRRFARLVPFEPFSFLVSSGGWHDRWSGTRVVRVRR